MAKQRKGNNEGLDGIDLADAADKPAPTTPAPTTTTTCPPGTMPQVDDRAPNADGRGRVVMITVTIPVAIDIARIESQRHVDLKLRAHQADALRRVTVGMDAQGASLANGTRVVGNQYYGGLRRLLELIGEAIEAAANS